MSSEKTKSEPIKKSHAEENLSLILATSDTIDKLYESLARLVGDQKITAQNAVLIATNLMQIVENYPDLTGEQKKTIVLHVLKKFVRDTMNDNDEDAVIMFIDLFLPSVIDTIISVDKKKIMVNIKKGFASCFACC